MNAHQKIKVAMRRHERNVLRHIRRVVVCRCGILHSRPWRKALERLEAKGFVRYSRVQLGYMAIKRRRQS
jgi:hypothetical protein